MDETNRLLAQLDGFDPKYIQKRWVGEYYGYSSYRDGEIEIIPNYNWNLHAIWNIEEKLTKKQRVDYANYLMALLPFDGECDIINDYEERSISKTTSLFSIIHASAPQRIEALLKLIKNE